MVKGLDKATATPILLVSYPDRYGVWNGKSEPGLKSLKLYPTLPKGATPGQYYAAINDILIHLAAELDVDLWTLDAVWSWLVKKTAVPTLRHHLHRPGTSQSGLRLHP